MKYILILITLAFASHQQPSKTLIVGEHDENITRKSPAQNHSELFKEWKILKINGIEQLNSPPTMSFEKEDSKVNGFAGCNNYFATFKISKNELSLGPAGTTRKLCPDMSVEDAFLRLLPKISRYEIVKKELYLYGQADELLIVAFSM